jgi:hypothetical protein
MKHLLGNSISTNVFMLAGLQLHLTHKYRWLPSAPHDSHLDSLSGKQRLSLFGTSYLSKTASFAYGFNM